MPKMKSKGAVKKRFRRTKSGKLKSNRPSRGHMHAIRSAGAKRAKLPLTHILTLPTNKQV